MPCYFFSEWNTDSKQSKIADTLCEYFTNIGPNLARNLGTTSSNLHLHSLFLKPADIERIAMSSKPSHASGFDEISMFNIKQVISEIS